MSNLLIPSYAGGFARNAAESANPGLWRGLIGLWQQALGLSGNTVRDWSGFEAHGINSGGVWLSSQYGPILDFDGTVNQSIDIAGVYPLGGFSVTVFAQPMSTNSKTTRFFTYSLDANNEWGLRQSTGSPAGYLRMNCRLAGTNYGRRTGWTDVTNDAWHSYAVTVDQSFIGAPANGAVAMWVDGRKVDTADSSETSFGTAGELRIGASKSTGADFRTDMQSSYCALHNRVLTSNEIQQLYVDPYALVRLRRRVFAAAVGAPPGVAPTSHLHGSLVGPLGGAV